MLCFTILKLIEMLKNNISKIFFPEFKSIHNSSWNEYMYIKNTKCLKWFVQFYYNSFQKNKGVSLCRIFFFTFLHLKLNLNYFLSKNNSLSIWALWSKTFLCRFSSHSNRKIANNSVVLRKTPAQNVILKNKIYANSYLFTIINFDKSK